MDRLTECVASIEGVEATPELEKRVGVELALLPARHQEVLRARFGSRDGGSNLLETIAADNDLSAHRVLVIEGQGLASLRQRLFD